MSKYTINKELEKAVKKRNLEQVRALLHAGANVDVRVGEDRATMLHVTSSVDITRELLLHSAEVNAVDWYRDTPLHSAISRGKDIEIVRELLKWGANVDATTRKGDTALNLAIKKQNVNIEVVKLLLEHGADINIRSWDFPINQFLYSPLDNAVYNKSDLTYAKLLIKFSLIKNFNKHYGKVICLDLYEKHSNYSELSSYLGDCICEVLQMQTDKIKDSFSLYELVARNSNRYMPCSNQLSMSLKKIDYSVHYPVYNDIISGKVKPYLEKAELLNKLSLIAEIYTESDMLNQDGEGKKVILDSLSVYNISEYLPNEDLLNFIVAFDDSDTSESASSSNNLDVLDAGLDETSTSNHAKRARLEET